MGDKAKGAPHQEMLSSLPLAILLHYGRIVYFAFSMVQVLSFTFKGLRLPYPPNNLLTEVSLLLFQTPLEIIRLKLGERGNLSEEALPLLLSCFLSAPAILAALYYALWQTFVLRLDVVVSSILICFQVAQTVIALATAVSFGRAHK
ncbi:transmembrane protein 216-like [Varroa jacobsoni]|uniref:Transmembrane protein n=1 Tax=Varroa destructor TaxID=109461 RepID=A0A7M7IXE9_VARDE|nr:transmembrane protein 216-like [Varroa destructor]XP_022643878.1 transmembrane protein 216-like [Varroa destructor]XP_022707068.1 transmembrane protein 216-like [Varroa jacobsoni]